MHHILTLIETCGRDRLREPVQIGVPLPLGKFQTVAEIQLGTSAHDSIDFAAIPLSRWHDKSIKWCLLKLYISIEANSSKALYISSVPNPHRYDEEHALTQAEDMLTIATANATFSLNRERIGLLEKLTYNNDLFSDGSSLSLIDGTGEAYETKVQKFSTSQLKSKTGLYETEVTIEAEATDKKGLPKLQIRQRWNFIHDLDVVKCQVTLHNPAAALHKGGHWDLGDPNSIYLKNAGFHQNLQPGDGKRLYKITLEDSWNESQANHLEIYQESSGGENWDSPVHVNRNNAIPLELKGYRVEINSDVTYGDRASPVFSIQTGECQYFNVRLKRFWQNFPKALALEEQELCIELFPKQFPDLHEIQPGEKKTHEMIFSFSSSPHDLSWVEYPLEIRLELDWLKNSKALPEIGHYDFDDRLSQIIKLGIDGENNFFVKREAIDEYGWRDFGDIYADHEALEYQGDDLLVSHYNNQYDPLLGFLNQYLVTGEPRWFELADDLARHISDIDVYDTTDDREEYNHGLFWHTDHYAPAATASHRTYSKNQPKNIYQDHIGSGGPGGQHCYTAGLSLHYCLTGYDLSRGSVIKLSKWMTHLYEGTGTITGTLISLKNRSKNNTKNILTGQYPLDRGTGNYISSLLDYYYLTSQQSVLDMAGIIIKQTASSGDDIDTRNLSDVENSWFYTVFLQSVIKFLLVKENAKQLDSAFFQARDILLHYTDWMANHERPYLEKPEVLEYPNATWAAQDLRKAYIFAFAAHFCPEEADRYIDKSTFFKDYVSNTLSSNSDSHHTRILSILMQHLLPQKSLGHRHFSNAKDDLNTRNNVPYVYRFSRVLWAVIKGAHIKTEIDWIARRSSVAKNLMNKLIK